MSGALAVCRDVGVLEAALNDTLAAGRLLAAYTTYYHEAAFAEALKEVPPADRDCARVLHFFSWAERFHRAVPARSAASARVSRSEWMVPARSGTATARPARRVVTRRWLDGRVIDERCEDRSAIPAGRIGRTPCTEG